MQEEILKVILELAQGINPDIKTLSKEDKVYGDNNGFRLSSLEITILLVKLEEKYNVVIDDVETIKDIVDIIEKELKK